VELKEPTLRKLYEAFHQATAYDFHYEVTAEYRHMIPLEAFQSPIPHPQLLFQSRQPDAVGTNLEFRLTIRIPERKALDRGRAGGP
jgi:hypothetical protein